MNNMNGRIRSYKIEEDGDETALTVTLDTGTLVECAIYFVPDTIELEDKHIIGKTISEVEEYINPSTLESLIKILKEVEGGDVEIETYICNEDHSASNTDTHVCAKTKGDTFINSERISELAAFTLINADGSVNYEAVGCMKKEGFNVFPLERDSFGWLIGGIQTSKGIVSFG